MGATSWTSTQARIQVMSQGGQMRLGAGEFRFVIGGTALTFACFAVSLSLCTEPAANPCAAPDCPDSRLRFVLQSRP
jgi:hypothetical protein